MISPLHDDLAQFEESMRARNGLSFNATGPGTPIFYFRSLQGLQAVKPSPIKYFDFERLFRGEGIFRNLFSPVYH